MSYGLTSHERGYQISSYDVLLSLGTALSGGSYAIRHWQQSNKPELIDYRLGHRVITFAQAMPLFGVLVALIERIIVFVYGKLYAKKEVNSSEESSPIDRVQDGGKAKEQVDRVRKRGRATEQACHIQDVPMVVGDAPPITIIPTHNFNPHPFHYHEFPVSYDCYDKTKSMDIAVWESLNKRSIEIGVDQYYITHPENSSSVIKTFGLGPCIGLILFHPYTKKTLFAHCYCSNPTLKNNLRKMLSLFADKETPLAECRAILLGGKNDTQQSIDTANVLISSLNDNAVLLDTTYLFPQRINKKYTFTPFASVDCLTGVVTIHFNFFALCNLKA